ncbi:MAG: hypothetical protein BEN19_09070 [Epulopiscium sp. Nuni2H_MBin003]|nr:MAG: hypothetical protein BEN19_09070 [Epulopiscium sp. Nuni2H_MBin003]
MHTKSMKKRPLEGIKVLDFSQVLAAPFCGMLLADLGAEVIKIERPGDGDISRGFGPYVNGVSLYFCQYNRGKKGIAIDLGSPEGKKVAMDLVAEVDIVIENYKSGTLEKLGIGYDEMIKVNPSLIYGSIAGFGTYGPLSHLPCMDIIAAARSGLVSQSGVEGFAPIKPGFSFCDTWSGLNLLRALSMALYHKQQTGEGTRIDLAMLDIAFYMGDDALLDYAQTGEFTPRTGNSDPWFSPNGEYTTNDGNVVIATTTEEEWQALCDALKLDALLHDERFATNELRNINRDVLRTEIEVATKAMGRYEVEKTLIEAGVPASAVQTLAEFIHSDEAKELELISIIKDQPGVGDYMATSTPIHFSKTPINHQAHAAQKPGVKTVEVLEELGYSKERIDELINCGAVHQEG